MTIFSILVLTSCAPKIRVDFNWEEYKNCEIKSETIIPKDIEETWFAIKKAGEELNIDIVLEDKESGLISYVKDDDRWDNVTLQLNILVLPKSSSETKLFMRGFLYSNRFRAMQIINIFPSDGIFEEEYLNTVYSQLTY